MVVSFVFFATSVLPGDYAATIVSQNFLQGGSGLGGRTTEQAVQDARAKLGTDKPIPQQYVTYMGKVVRGDFGKSFRFGTPAFQTVRTALPYTLQLGSMTVLISILLG